MYAYEISYRENGILKNKCFGYRERFELFRKRISGKANVTEIRLGGFRYHEEVMKGLR